MLEGTVSVTLHAKKRATTDLQRYPSNCSSSKESFEFKSLKTHLNYCKTCCTYSVLLVILRAVSKYQFSATSRTWIFIILKLKTSDGHVQFFPFLLFIVWERPISKNVCKFIRFVKKYSFLKFFITIIIFISLNELFCSFIIRFIFWTRPFSTKNVIICQKFCAFHKIMHGPSLLKLKQLSKRVFEN